MRILVVEDNPKMAALLRHSLTEQGYAVDVARGGHDGEQLAVEAPYDLVLLDVMLPDLDGADVCRNLRRRGVETPILLLTALSTTGDKVRGLDAGADDYVTKPFEFDELLARIRALLRRGEAQEASRLSMADLQLDLLQRQVMRGRQRIKLTAKEFSLLEYFMRNPGRLLSRTAIGEHVWDMNFDSDSNVIDVYISMLRRKIEPEGAPRLIHTVIGSGYCMRLPEEGD